MHKKKGESKKFYQHHIGVRDNFAGLVGVVVATPDLHDQPPVEKKKREKVIAKMKVEIELQVNKKLKKKSTFVN